MFTDASANNSITIDLDLSGSFADPLPNSSLIMHTEEATLRRSSPSKSKNKFGIS